MSRVSLDVKDDDDDDDIDDGKGMAHLHITALTPKLRRSGWAFSM